MASSRTCGIGSFEKMVKELCQEYVDEEKGKMRKQLVSAAKYAASELRRAKGEYSGTSLLGDRTEAIYEKGWTYYTQKWRDGKVAVVVANKTAPSLTWLIEKGHELFVFGRDTGKRTKARPHIANAYEKARSKVWGGAG